MGKSKKKVDISQAKDVLDKKRLEILTVHEWASAMGYTRSHFSRYFKNEFSLSPKDYLKAFRLKLIKEEIIADPRAIGYKIALNTGFDDEKSLHKFLSYH